MAEVGRPTGLIGYDTDINMLRRAEGKPPIYRIVRARTILYATVMAIVGGVMLYTLATRTHLAIDVLHARNPLFVMLSDGSIRNDYTVRILNKAGVARHFAIEVDGLKDPKIRFAGVDADTAGQSDIVVGPDQTREMRLSVTVPSREAESHSMDVVIRVRDLGGSEVATARDHFIARGQ
jgi:polyferredoxin